MRALALALTWAAVAPAPPVQASPMTGADEARRVTDLSNGWRFRYGSQPATVIQPGFDDRDWQAVTLPHSWNRAGEYRLERTAATNADQGIGWYRLHIPARAVPAGRRYYIQFDGVGIIAQLWVNGVRIGEHRGAFSAFRFDITSALQDGRDNVIVVAADNTAPAPGSSTEDVVPLDGDFLVHGGIYRGVSLISTSGVGVDLLDHGGPGVYIRTARLASRVADVEVTTRLRNDTTSPRDVRMTTRIVHRDGTIVATNVVPLHLDPAATVEVQRTITLAHPRRWQGLADPYLYRLRVEIAEGPRVLDRVEQPFGVRTIAIDPNAGLFLNGRHVDVIGAARHQEVGGKGWALTRADHLRDIRIMREMGLNAVRQTHYQQAQDFTDAADRTGMLVWAELGFVKRSAFGPDLPRPQAVDNARQQLTELIRQNYNHPSIFTWSVGNEVDLAASQNRQGPPARSLEMLKALNALAKQLDPSRPTAYADCCENYRRRSDAQFLSGVTDLIGYNRYLGWYGKTPADLGPELDRLHAEYPGLPIAISEYGAGGALTQHTDNPLGGKVAAYSRPHPEEYQSWFHEQSWRALASRHFLFGKWIWVMFDSGSLIRQEGDAVDMNDKGLVTQDRKIRKDAFYFYQATLAHTPVLHIAGRRYVDRAYPVVDVRLYSNAQNVRVTVNGAKAGTARCVDRICVLKDVRLRPGRNVIAARATIGGRSITDRVVWTAPDARSGLHIAAGTLTGYVDARGTRFGSDNFFDGGTPGEPKNGSATWREGSFDYVLPLPNGRWTVRLTLPDPVTIAAPPTDFTLRASGAQTPLKITTGSASSETPWSFPVIVSDGRLRLSFRPGTGPARVSAIEVLPRF
jgi:beta-galactosidase